MQNARWSRGRDLRPAGPGSGEGRYLAQEGGLDETSIGCFRLNSQARASAAVLLFNCGRQPIFGEQDHVCPVRTKYLMKWLKARQRRWLAVTIAAAMLGGQIAQP